MTPPLPGLTTQSFSEIQLPCPHAFEEGLQSLLRSTHPLTFKLTYSVLDATFFPPKHHLKQLFLHNYGNIIS